MRIPRLSLIATALFACLAAAVTAAAQTPEETFNKGNTAYANADYSTAAAAYREVLNSVQSPEVHYNLGNALAQQNKWSEAAFHYMKAYALDPNFEAARANLLLSANRMGLAAQYPQLPRPGRLVSERAWTTIAAVALWAALIFFFHGDFVRFRIPLAKTLGCVSLLALAVSILSIVQHELFKDWAVVSSPLVSLRLAPTEQSPSDSVLIEGDPIRILGEQKGFFHVMTSSGAEGFILQKEAYSLGHD